MAHFELEDGFSDQAKIKVIGVGGAGGNAVSTMISHRVEGVEFIVANTDTQALEKSTATHRIQIGPGVTRGLGAGANPDRGREAALESVEELAEVLKGADMVFVTAGMGGGTGTGAAPIIAQVARECGCLTVGVVTKPFRFEGRRRLRIAEEGIARLEKAVDTLITIPNDRLLAVTSSNTSMLDGFKIADEVLQHATQGVSDLITIPGIINVDFADVRTIMANQGRALMGMGIASDEGRALAAAQQAISSPLLEDVTIHGATGILINITAGPDLRLHEVEEAASLIQEAAHEDCNIIFGAVIDESMGDALRLTVIATGFDQHTPAQEDIETALKAHGTSRRRQSQVVVAGTVGPQGIEYAPSMPRSAASSQSSSRHVVASPAKSATLPNPMASQASASQRARYPQQPALFSSSQLAGGPAPQGGIPAAPHGHVPQPVPAQTGAHWNRQELVTDPSEIPAFLRRRDETGGFVR